MADDSQTLDFNQNGGDLHDKAMSWAKSNPQDPRSQHIMAKAWAAKNPQDPRSQAIMQHASSVLTQSTQGNPRKPDNGHNLSNQDYSSPSAPISKKFSEDPRLDTLRRTVSGIASGGVGEIAAPLGQLIREIPSNAIEWFTGVPSNAAKGITGAASSVVPQTPIGALTQGAAERSRVLSQVKDESGLGDYVSGKVGQANAAYDTAQIEPRMASQYKRAAGQSIEVVPDQFKGIHPDIDNIVSKYPINAETGKVTMPMEDALDLRSELNSNTRFKQGGVFSTPDQVMAAKSRAYDAGNSLRDSIKSVDPEIAKSSEELRQAYNLKNSVTGSASKNPIGAVKGSLGTTKGSNISAFDQAAGTDLRGLGQNIDTAVDRLKTPINPLTGIPGEIIRKKGIVPGLASYLINNAGRMTDATAQGLNSPTGQVIGTGLSQLLGQSINNNNINK